MLDGSLNRYKANLHCHTDVSDGRLTPAEVKDLYKRHGYSIVAYTDHDVMIAHDDLNDGDFLALHGYEMEFTNEHDPDNSQKNCHICLIQRDPDNMKMVCWHREKYLFGNAPKYKDQVQFDESLPDYERIRSGLGVSEVMKIARENGYFVTYNHPTWSLETAEDYMHYHGMHAMEICNFGCMQEGYEDYNPHVYDEMLRGGERIFCIGADDNHNGVPEGVGGFDSCGAFTVIFAKELTYKSIMDAMFEGEFYASQGPEIYSMYYEDGRIHLKCSPAVHIFSTTNRRRTWNYYMENRKPLTEVSFRVHDDDKYLRITIVDDKGRYANTIAYWRDELLKEDK
ncbi:MAG: PHP domain-containing protein [Clostridia bacterium]|nr:PHP domain-containing protein [Clostridia bacterium]